MNFATPWALMLGLAVFAAAWLTRWSAARGAAGLVAALGEWGRLPDAVARRRRQRDGMMAAGLALLVVAAAEPRFGREMQTLRATGSDLVVVLDLSRSMDATDVSPSRLQRAKRELADLFAVLQGDRVGLVVFAGGAFPHVPLTLDTLMVERVIDEVDTSTFGAQGSSMADGLRAAIKLLTRSPTPTGKAIVLLSDGEDHEPELALAAAEEAAALEIPIFSLLVGEGTSEIPDARGPLRDAGGQVVQTTPNPDLLRDLARATGGAYVASVPGADDVERLYGELRGAVEAVEREVTEREVWRSAFQLPLGLGLFLLWLASVWGDGVRARAGGRGSAVVGSTR